MSARLLDGTAIAATIRADLRPTVEAFSRRAGRPPGLGIVLAGDTPASEIYVRNKRKAAAEAGVDADLVQLPGTAALADVLEVVERLNRSPRHDAVLVQAPLPSAMGAGAARRLFDAIDPAKDVDGFHPLNAGRLVQNRAALAPCTPAGIVELLDRSGVTIAGARAVVIGRSEIVGKPLALLLLHRDATVTICHSRSRDLAGLASGADLLVVATGRAGFVTPDFVRKGATVVDVGVNRVTDRDEARRLFAGHPDRLAAFDLRGSAVVGDVHPAVAEVAGALTPVPGGVGPMTIAMLLRNTVAAALARL